MTSVSHALIGAAIAAKIPDTNLAGTVAIATHLLCDAIPHWDLGTNWRVRPRYITGVLAILETLFAVFGTIVFFSSRVPYLNHLTIVVLLSLIPDWFEVPYYLTMPNSPKPFYYIYRLQSMIHSKLQAPWGIFTQMVIVGVFLGVGFLT